MSCRFARATDEGIACDLMTRGGWQQAVAIDQLREAGVPIADDAELCPVATRGAWLRCPCRRVPGAPAAYATLRL